MNKYYDTIIEWLGEAETFDELTQMYKDIVSALGEAFYDSGCMAEAYYKAKLMNKEGV